MKETEVNINYSKPGVYESTFELGKVFFQSFKNEELTDADVTFNVRIERTEQTMLIKIHFEGEVRTVCDRCLGSMTLPVEGDELINVRFSDEPHEDDSDEVTVPVNATTLDLGQWFYEYVVTAIPMKHSHPEREDGTTECDSEVIELLNRANSTSPADDAETIDPRWEELLKLK